MLSEGVFILCEVYMRNINKVYIQLLESIKDFHMLDCLCGACYHYQEVRVD